MVEQIPEKKNETESSAGWVAVGGPLFLGEASFLVSELRAHDISCDIQSDLSRAGQAVHSVLVGPENLDTAVAIKSEMLDENQHAKAEQMHPSPASKIRFSKALIAGILGFAVGARLCLRFKNPVLLFSLPFLLGAVSFALFSYLTKSAADKKSEKRQ